MDVNDVRQNAYTWDSCVSRIHVLSLKMLKHETFLARFHFDTAEHELSEVELVMVLAMLAIWR